MLDLRGVAGAWIAFALIVGPSASLALRQEEFGTPASLPASSQAQCAIEPRTLDELVVLAEEVEVTPADTDPIYFIAEVPPGTPADAATVDAVTTVIIEMTSCVRDGDTLRLLAHYTDGYLRAISSAEHTFIENLRATPVSDRPVNPDIHVAAVQEVTLLEDGRISAIVTLGGVQDSHPAPGRTVLMIFATVDDRWSLDGQYERVWTGDPTMEPPIAIADLIATPVDDRSTPES